jgi:hypothetical protein
MKASILTWLLGQKFEDIEFQNYAMHRLMHAIVCQSGPIDPLTFRYVRSKSVPGSKLILFLERMLFMNWRDEHQVKGSIEDWHAVFGNDAELLCCSRESLGGIGRRDRVMRLFGIGIWFRRRITRGWCYERTLIEERTS